MSKRKSSHTNTESQRCGWVTEDPEYIRYHDEEWGIPEHNSQKLFEMLCLEGQQAGISWITVLKKRDNYREAFHGFDPYKISKMNATEIQKLSMDSRIIRHRLKLESIVHNAKCYLEMEQNNDKFSKFIWSFVNHKPVINNWKSYTDIPNKTLISENLSKRLKQKGFKFVGGTICYAFMQACGLVNDHVLDCHCRISMKKRKCN